MRYDVTASLAWNVNRGWWRRRRRRRRRSHQPLHLAGCAHEESLVEAQARGHSGGVSLQLGAVCGQNRWVRLG